MPKSASKPIVCQGLGIIIFNTGLTLLRARAIGSGKVWNSPEKKRMSLEIRKFVLAFVRMIFWLIKICRNKLMFGVLIVTRGMSLREKDGMSIII